MFKVMFDLAVSSFNDYMGDGYVYILFIIALVFMLIFKFSKDDRCLFVYPSILMIAVIFFPPTTRLITTLLGKNVYWRVFWMLPIIIVIPYAFTKIIDKLGPYLRALGLAIVIAAIIFTGKSIFTDYNFTEIESVYKIPSEVIQVCDALDDSLEDGEQAKALASAELTPYIRQYDAGIKLLYGRNPTTPDQQAATSAFDFVYIDVITATYYARLYECNYLIYNIKQDLTEPFENYGYYEVARTENYVICKYMP